MDDVDDSAVNEQLNAIRIRQVSAMRQAVHRSRSHALVALLVCVVAAIQCLIRLLQHLARGGAGWQTLVYASAIGLAVAGAMFFRKRMIGLSLEAATLASPPPATPPDFSALGDGSQRWKNLDELTV